MAQQIGIMLAENYQRKQLTMAEEISAMQLMLEHGDDVEGIATKTGIHKKTVQRRIKISEAIGVDTVAAAERMAGHPISLDDYEKLCDIDDPQLRNEVLDKIGTSEFDMAHTKALEKQVKAASRKNITDTLDKVAVKIDHPEILENPDEFIKNNDVVFVEKIYRHDTQDLQTTQKIVNAATESGAKVFYKTDTDGAVHVYAAGGVFAEEASKINIEEHREKQANEESIFRLEKVFKQAYGLRISYVKKLAVTSEIKKNVDAAAAQILFTRAHEPQDYVIRSLLDIKGPLEKESTTWSEACSVIIKKHSDRRDTMLLRGVYSRLEPGICKPNCTNFTPNERIEHVYDFLETLGYLMSEEEVQLTDGTHPLYAQPENDKAI